MPGASQIALLHCGDILGITIQHALSILPKIECIALQPRGAPQIARVSNKQGNILQITGGVPGKVPGQAVPKQAVGGQASTTLVRFPSDALIAVAPSSHRTPATQETCRISCMLTVIHCVYAL